MRLASYRVGAHSTFGIVTDGGVIDLGGRVASSSLRALIADEPDAAAAFARETPDHALADIIWLPPIPDPEAIICMGLNTHSHMAEFRSLNGPDAAAPTRPWVFLRLSRSVVGHDQPIVRPNGSPLFDYEGEIAVVIGKRARHVARDDALDVVFGYSCFNEGSVRDYQMHSPFYTSGKNFPRTAGFGPWIVTADEIAEVADLKLTTRVDGEVLQEMPYHDLIYDFRDIIEYVTSFTELNPGDVLVTGTAAGVAGFRNPPRWLKPGEVCEVEVTGIGTLRNAVVDAEGADRGPVTRDDPVAAVAELRATLSK